MEPGEQAPAPVVNQVAVGEKRVEALEDPRVIRIMPDSRYVIVVPDSYPMEQVMDLLRTVKEWFESGQQFVIIQGVKLVRVSGPAPEERTSDPDGA